MKRYYILSLVFLTACSSAPSKKDSSNKGSSNAIGEPNDSADNDTATSAADLTATDSSSDSDGAKAPMQVALPVKYDNDSFKSDLAKAYQNRESRRIEQIISKKLGEDPNNLLALNTLGLQYFRSGAFGMARLVWERAAKSNPNESALQNNLALTYMRTGDDETAFSYLKKAVQMKPSDEAANANLGYYYLKYKNYSLAETVLRQAYDVNKKSYANANNYAIALYKNGKVDDSIKVYETLIHSNSNQVEALLNYADLLIQEKKDKAKAKDLLNRAKLMSQDGSTLRYISELESKIGS
jgi:Flp pilus assembly protein TadD